MEIEETKEVKITKTVITAIKCDNCKKINQGEKLPNDWAKVESRHFDWGNDSIESFESYHVCSSECYKSLLKTLLKENEDYNTFEIDGRLSSTFATNLVKSINNDLSEKGTATKLQKLLSEHRDNLQNKIHKHLSRFTNDFVYFELNFAHQDKVKFLNHLLNGKMSFEYLESVLEKLDLNNK